MPTFHSPLTAALALALAASAGIIDTSTRRIPNWLTAPAAVIGLGVNFMIAGPHGALGSLAGGLLMLAIFLPVYVAGGFGAGDVKALAALGLLLGPRGAFAAAGCTLIAGAAGGVLVLAARGGSPALRSLLQRWSLRGCVLISTGRAPRLEPPAGDAARHRFPYGLAIACGTAAALLIWS